ncbi:MAG: hypothetical protein C00003105_01532 [ANME-2 cluster archaeon HR1]|nr:MAG: hypothetical protein C00003105_01532 [ANME-2 cluster archaeon HR1]
MIVIDDSDLLINIICPAQVRPLDSTITEPLYLRHMRLINIQLRIRIHHNPSTDPDVLYTAVDLGLCNLESNRHRIKTTCTVIKLSRAAVVICHSLNDRYIILLKVFHSFLLIKIIKIESFYRDDTINQHGVVLNKDLFISIADIVCSIDHIAPS